tara:strand:+ start:468 stop:692 length:225 start_codon:yes stop_codon:yes gene_type:complete
MKKGVSLNVVVFIVFLILKLVGVITWSWVWVTSPIWIGVILGILVLIAIEVLKAYLDKRSDKRFEEYRKNKFNK